MDVSEKRALIRNIVNKAKTLATKTDYTYQIIYDGETYNFPIQTSPPTEDFEVKIVGERALVVSSLGKLIGEFDLDKIGGFTYIYNGLLPGSTFFLDTVVTNTLYVDGNRTDIYTETGSIVHPYKTIQDAITAAAIGDLIYIANGTYPEQLTVDKTLYLKAQGRYVLVSIDAANDAVLTINGACDGFESDGISYNNIHDSTANDLAVFIDNSGGTLGSGGHIIRNGILTTGA